MNQWCGFCFGKRTKSGVSFNVGKRTNKTLRRVLDTLNYQKLKKYLPTD